MRIPSASPRRLGRIEIIPLIDIIFFLLATFVMVSLSMVKNQGVPVKLPKASTGQPQERTRLATVTVAADSTVYLDKEKVSFEELSRRLEARHRQEPELKVLFSGDRNAYFGDVVKALDEVRKLGIDKIAVQTTGADS